ncbi:MAG TPA: hypothetical protein VIH36_06385 [Casimicrobiaceae bacterium]
MIRGIRGRIGPSLGLVLSTMATAALAANVAVVSDEESSQMAAAVTGTGNTATVITESQLEAGILGFDVLLIGHHASLTNAGCTAIQNFLNAGKGVITEWNTVYNLFSNPGPNLYGNAGPQCGLFTGTVGYGNDVGTNTPITLTNPASPLLASLPNPLQLQGGSEFFYVVTGYDTGIWSVVATYDGNGSLGNPAIMTASFGAGRVIVGAFDWGDELGNIANDDTLLADFVAAAANGAPPPPPPPTAIIPVPTLADSMLAALALMLAALGFTALHRRSRRA